MRYNGNANRRQRNIIDEHFFFIVELHGLSLSIMTVIERCEQTVTVEINATHIFVVMDGNPLRRYFCICLSKRFRMAR